MQRLLSEKFLNKRRRIYYRRQHYSLNVHHYQTLQKAALAKAFFATMHKAMPFEINAILTDNSEEFTADLLGILSCPVTKEREFAQLP